MAGTWGSHAPSANRGRGDSGDWKGRKGGDGGGGRGGRGGSDLRQRLADFAALLSEAGRTSLISNWQVQAQTPGWDMHLIWASEFRFYGWGFDVAGQALLLKAGRSTPRKAQDSYVIAADVWWRRRRSRSYVERSRALRRSNSRF